MSDTPADSDAQCGREDCEGEAKWRWWNGMGTFGPYCDDCAREQLADEDRCPITRREDVSDVYVLPAGIQPIDGAFPTIRTKNAFDVYLETGGEEPHQCDVGWCSKIGTECGHDGENPLVTDGGRDQSNAEIAHFTSSDTDEWATPPEFVRPLASAVGGFHLDPAAGAETSPIARNAYTVEDDGLHSEWFGRVWCNPPYSEMEAWTRKAVSESQRPDVVLILFLVKGDSSTDWWQAAISEASCVAMLNGRLEFGEAGNTAPFPSHVFGFGDVPDAALDVLARRGTVLTDDSLHQRTQQERIA